MLLGVIIYEKANLPGLLGLTLDECDIKLNMGVADVTHPRQSKILQSIEHSQDSDLPSQEPRSGSRLENETHHEKNLHNQWLTEMSQHIPEQL